jgi:hypothetical protein
MKSGNAAHDPVHPANPFNRVQNHISYMPSDRMALANWKSGLINVYEVKYFFPIEP